MSDNDFTIIDIFRDIFKKTLLSFIVFFLLSSIMFSTILLFLQKNYIKPGFYEFSYDAVISDNYNNLDFLLLQKTHNLYQLSIFDKLSSEERDKIFFNGENFFLNTYFPIYYKILDDETFISKFNKEYNTNYELISLSNLKYSENEKTYFTAVMKSLNGDFDKFKEFINLLNNNINKKLKSEFLKIYSSQEIINIKILKNLKLNLMNDKNNAEEFKIQIIDEYLNLLDKNHKNYLGNIIKNELINVASIENILKIETKSNRNFVILRSIILGLLISFFLIFFIYTFRLGFFNK